MREEIQERVFHEERRDKTPSTKERMKLKGYNPFTEEGDRLQFFNVIHRYWTQQFYAQSLDQAGHWRIRTHEVISRTLLPNGDTSIFLRVSVFRDDFALDVQEGNVVVGLGGSVRLITTKTKAGF